MTLTQQNKLQSVKWPYGLDRVNARVSIYHSYSLNFIVKQHQGYLFVLHTLCFNAGLYYLLKGKFST